MTASVAAPTVYEAVISCKSGRTAWIHANVLHQRSAWSVPDSRRHYCYMISVRSFGGSGKIATPYGPATAMSGRPPKNFGPNSWIPYFIDVTGYELTYCSYQPMIQPGWSLYAGVHTLKRDMLALWPVGGLPAGHELNSQPSSPTVVGGASRDDLPDSFSAGAEIIALKPASVRLS